MRRGRGFAQNPGGPLRPTPMSERSHYDFSELFDAEEYLYFMEDSLRLENTVAQLQFIEQRLDLRAGSSVLDLGCGHGRHAIALAQRGCTVTGIDLSESFLEVARRQAAAQAVELRLLLGDIGALRYDAEFNAAICLFDAFGFFDDAHCLRILQGAYAALRPGGRLLLDLRTREWMLRQPPCAVVDKGNGDLMIDRQHFDIESGRLVDRRTTLRGQTRRDVAFSVRLFAWTEIRMFLQSAGFEIEGAYGGFDGAPLAAERPRTLVIGRKPQA